MDDIANPLEENQEAIPVVVEGRVKWFDHRRGFGFIVSDVHASDILLHANTLLDFGWSTIAEGVELRFYVDQMNGGIKVREIVSIGSGPPVRFLSGDECEPLNPDVLEHLPVLPARVKWIDVAKGYGFVNVFGNGEDVFLHLDVLRAAGVSCFSAGEAIALRMMRGARGLIAVQVFSWSAGAQGRPPGS